MTRSSSGSLADGGLFVVVICLRGFPGGSVVKKKKKNLPANAGEMGLIPELGRSPRKGNGNPLQYYCLGNPMDRGAWWAAVHGVARVGHNLATEDMQCA